jgi:lipopolysaccharide biosynthesis glycosyltransferase
LADILTDDFVWLDSDILCNTGWDSIFEIKETFNNSNFAVAAAKDRQVTIETLISAPEKPIYINDPTSYVNAGVMYFNPLVWKRNKLDLRWVETVLSADLLKIDLLFPEQNVLNYLLKEDLQLLPSKFNSIVGDSKLEPSLITHYAGYPKPWVLSARGKALYLMAESMNWNRPQFRPSREGRFKTEYFQYWQAEEDLLDDLRVNRPELYAETLRRKRAATREINRLEKIKYAIARFIGVEFLNTMSGKKPKLTGIQSQLWQDFS